MTARDPEARAIRDLLAGLFEAPFDEPLHDDLLNEAALRIFAFQFARNALYAAFCERRKRTPGRVRHWSEIPAVPSGAFREVPLLTGDPAAAETVFRTSGTSRGAARRGVHYILDLSIYHASLVPAFAACVLPDGLRPRMLSLVPPGSEMADSSLAHMIDMLMDRLGAPESTHCASVRGGIDEARLAGALRAAEAAGAPVCLLGTSFAFVHWLDALARRGERCQLPAGSRLMDTGGYKGRSREVDAGELRGMYRDLLGLPESHCVNEYGMTEMCSQFYDSTLRDAVRGRDRPRRKLVPPWVRTRVVDPETLEPLPHGRTGLLQHLDLANARSVCAIQTEDVGVQVDDGFRLIGRVAGATPRGCSIAMDLLVEAARAARG